mmetsp:Transcript_10639/g.13807  ORF Transcript_10639/g.13807 Transcript_10639/m.13807 type:complete len:91 (-) Transcript_10639:28-300(-)
MCVRRSPKWARQMRCLSFFKEHLFSRFLVKVGHAVKNMCNVLDYHGLALLLEVTTLGKLHLSFSKCPSASWEVRYHRQNFDCTIPILAVL